MYIVYKLHGCIGRRSFLPWLAYCTFACVHQCGISTDYVVYTTEKNKKKFRVAIHGELRVITVVANRLCCPLGLDMPIVTGDSTSIHRIT